MDILRKSHDLNQQNPQQGLKSSELLKHLHLSEDPDPSTRDEIEYYLRMFYEFKLNIVTGRLYYKHFGSTEFIEMTDYSLNSIIRNMDRTEFNCTKNQLIEILMSNFTPKYDPFKEYLEGLPEWDGVTDHIKQWAETVKTTDDELWGMCFRKWIVGVAGSLVDHRSVNQTAPIFCGPQGIGKTRWISTLVPNCLRPYYFSGTIQLSNKDSITQISECMIIDLDELENMNRRSIGDLKSLMTREQIRVRRPYGKITEHLPRRASFIGSINQRDFLKDETGSRRFLCFEVEKMYPEHGLNVDLLFAQALVLYNSDFPHWFNQEETAIIEQNNEKFRKSTLEEEFLCRHFEVTGEGESCLHLTTSQIAQSLNKRERMTVSNSTVQRLGKALTKCGFQRIKKGGVYCWKVWDLAQPKSQLQ